MYCPKCGTENVNTVSFCEKCNYDFRSLTKSQAAEPSQPAAPQQNIVAPQVLLKTSDELKESGAVTALSTVGLVFGLIGLLGSFIPCIGALAFFVGIPAALISGIGLGIAYFQKAKQTFAIVALTLSLLGVVISGFQYFSLASAGKQMQEQIIEMNEDLLEQMKKQNNRR